MNQPSRAVLAALEALASWGPLDPEIALSLLESWKYRNTLTAADVAAVRAAVIGGAR